MYKNKANETKELKCDDSKIIDSTRWVLLDVKFKKYSWLFWAGVLFEKC
jgi:hypothetical protein